MYLGLFAMKMNDSEWRMEQVNHDKNKNEMYKYYILKYNIEKN